MIFYTSIAPRHFHEGRQLECVNSWLQYGRVISVNCKYECDTLAPLYPGVEFVETTQTREAEFGKPYVALNAILKVMQENGGGVLINSDIEITADKMKWDHIESISKKPGNFLYLHRYNFENERFRGDIYLDGVDVFFLYPEHLNALIESGENEYCLGHCYFDLWIPFYLFMKNFSIQTTRAPIAFHKNHPTQYRAEHWDRYGQYTGRKFFMSKQQSGKISDRMYHLIRSNTTTV